MSEHVLVVGGGLTLPGLLRTLGTNVRTSVACQLAIVPKLLDQRAHQRILGLRAEADDQEWLDIVLAVHRIDPITRVATFGERDQARAAAIAAELGLAMHTPQTVEWVHHKPSMRRRLAALGLDDTAHAVVRSVAELREFLRAHGFPCIAKPAVGAGSIGIHRIDNAEDLAAALRTAGVTGEWTGGGVLVERLHVGPQVSVEAFSDAGEHQIVCVTQKYSDPRSHVELGHVLPAALPADQLAAIEEYVPAVLSALRIDFGPTHTELVLTADGPRIIETHTRVAGDLIPNLVLDALGVDLAEYTVRQVLGEAGLLPRLRAQLADAAGHSRHEAVWFAASEIDCLLDSVGEPAQPAEGVREVRWYRDPGDRLERLSSSDSRFGHVRAHGDSPEQAIERARQALNAITVKVLLPPEVAGIPREWGTDSWRTLREIPSAVRKDLSAARP